MSTSATPDSILGVWLYMYATYSMARGHSDELAKLGYLTAACNIIVLDVFEIVIIDLSVIPLLWCAPMAL